MTTSIGTFDAEVQYGDWRGTVEADNADFMRDLEHVFRDDGLLTSKDFVVGVRIFNGENSRDELNPLSVRVYTVKANTFEEAKAALRRSPITLRMVHRDMTHDHFFRQFKRFNIALVHEGLDLIGKHVIVDDVEEPG
ncbi:MAG: hypothetical protein ACXWC0_22220 [Burkholderiales bacterium]